MDLRSLLRDIRKRPGMYLPGEGFQPLVSFLIGRDTASGELTGFREFLILKLGGGNNLVFWGLVMEIALPDGYSHPLTEAEDRKATDTLFDLLDEFLAEMQWNGALPLLFHEYWVWRQDQSWYDPELVRFDSSPAGAVVTVGETASLLGVSEAGVFDLVAARKLPPKRSGPELLFHRRAVGKLLSPQATESVELDNDDSRDDMELEP